MEGYWWLLVAVIVYFGATLQGLARKQADVESRLLMISRHLGIVAEPGSEPSAHVRSLAADGSKYVEALRAYRTETGTGIKEARRAVDPLTPRA